MQPTKWQIQVILAQKIIFGHLLKYLSEMDLSAVLTPALSDYHWLRRPLHGLLHCSCIAVVYPTLELICEFWPSKFSHYPSRPATRSFCHYPTRSRPEVKNHYPSVSAHESHFWARSWNVGEIFFLLKGKATLLLFRDWRVVVFYFGTGSGRVVTKTSGSGTGRDG